MHSNKHTLEARRLDEHRRMINKLLVLETEMDKILYLTQLTQAIVADINNLLRKGRR